MGPAGRGVAVVYISGTGRSGSTALDMKLGQQRGVLGAGELSRFHEWHQAGLPCTCGLPLRECPQWDKLVPDREVRVGISRGGDGEAFGEFLENAESDGHRVVVDSSKTSRPTRSRVSAWVASGVPVVMVHLVRNPFDVATSVRSGSNQWLEGTSVEDRQYGRARVYLHWLIWNLTAYAQARLLGVPYVLVTNEALRQDPDDIVTRVSRALSMPLGEQSAPRDHAVAGNRMRRVPEGDTSASDTRPMQSTRSRPVVTTMYRGLIRILGRADAASRPPTE